jgi:hypothetical protein
MRSGRVMPDNEFLGLGQLAANGSQKTDQAGAKQRQSRLLGNGGVSDVFLRSQAKFPAQQGVKHQAVLPAIGCGRRQSQIGSQSMPLPRVGDMHWRAGYDCGKCQRGLADWTQKDRNALLCQLNR